MAQYLFRINFAGWKAPGGDEEFEEVMARLDKMRVQFDGTRDELMVAQRKLARALEDRAEAEGMVAVLNQQLSELRGYKSRIEAEDELSFFARVWRSLRPAKARRHAAAVGLAREWIKPNEIFEDMPFKEGTYPGSPRTELPEAKWRSLDGS